MTNHLIIIQVSLVIFLINPLEAQFIYPKGYGGISIVGQYSKVNKINGIYGNANVTFSRLSYAFIMGSDWGETVANSLTYGLGVSYLVSNPKSNSSINFSLSAEFQHSRFNASNFQVNNSHFGRAEVKSTAYSLGPTLFKRISIGKSTVIIPAFSMGIVVLDVSVNEGSMSASADSEILGLSLTIAGLGAQLTLISQYFNKQFGFGIGFGVLVPNRLGDSKITN